METVNSQIEIKINATIIGKLWMGGYAYKTISIDLDRHQKPFKIHHDNLFDTLCNITSDGDFQSCAIAHAYITLSYRESNGYRTKLISKEFDLENSKIAKEDFWANEAQLHALELIEDQDF